MEELRKKNDELASELLGLKGDLKEMADALDCHNDSLAILKAILALKNAAK